MYHPVAYVYTHYTNTVHFMLASSAICTCSGNSPPDWTLELLHVYRKRDQNGMLAAIFV
jgi:hypothetical protein